MVTQVKNDFIPVVPGVTGVFANISASAGYSILDKDGTAKDLANVAKAPIVKRETDYFNSVLSKMQKPDDLIKDRRALQFLLTSYGLGTELNQQGIIKKVLTEDPTKKSSLVNQLADTRWKTMATDLDFFNSGLDKLKSTSVTQSYDLKVPDNQYLQVQKQNSLGEDLGDYYTSKLSAKIGANGILQTSDGNYVMGLKLDNLGNVQGPKDATAGYQTSDLRPVQINWLDNKKTPAKTLSPDIALKSTEAVADPNRFTDVEVVPTDHKDSNGNYITGVVTQTLTKGTGDSWNWKVTDASNNVLYDRSVDLTFNTDGTIKSIDGTDVKDSKGNINNSKTITLNWADATATSQSFDLSKVFQRSDFTQTVRVTDNAGTDRNVRLDYIKTSDSENRWQVKVWNADTNTLGGVIDFKFDANGSVVSAGTYQSDTGKITASDGTSTNTTANVTVDWGVGLGGSDLKIDFAKVFSGSTPSTETKTTSTDSISLGKRKRVDIDINGTVSATYAKADGSGDYTVSLYRLAINKFGSAGSLNRFGTTDYFTANANTGTDTIQPLGVDKDSLGNVIDGRAGQMLSPPTTTSTQKPLDKVLSGYNQNIFEQAIGKENVALRYAVYFKKNASKLTNIDSVLGDSAARNLVGTVFGIPKEVAKQSLSTQEQIFSRNLDVKKLQDPKFVDSLIKRFLAISDVNSPPTGSTASSPITNLIGGSGQDAGSILSTVTTNINIFA